MKISNQEYMKAIEDGVAVVAATVKQNQQTPTGQVVLIISDGSTEQAKVVNVPDVIAKDRSCWTGMESSTQRRMSLRRIIS